MDAHSRCAYGILILALMYLVLPLQAAGPIVNDNADLFSEQTYRVKSVQIEGNLSLKTTELKSTCLTQAQSRIMFWKKDMIFDPTVWAADCERMKRFYARHGFFSAVVKDKTQVDHEAKTVVAKVEIQEGPVCNINDIHIVVNGKEQDTSNYKLGIQVGDVFSTEAYQEANKRIQQVFLNNAYAWVKVDASALVELDKSVVKVTYKVHSGPRCRFGLVEYAGLERVRMDHVLREMCFETDQIFSAELLEKYRSRLLALGWFKAVIIEMPDREQKP